MVLIVEMWDGVAGVAGESFSPQSDGWRLYLANLSRRLSELQSIDMRTRQKNC
jgi:hypothetical protein